MDNLIINAEKVDLTGDDIMIITNNEAQIMLYSDLENIDDINYIFNDKNCIALLYETRKNFGHWVGLLKYENTIEFFDPYGLKPDEELKYASYNVRKTSDGELIPHLSHLLQNSNMNIVYNSIRLQKWLPDINTCGRHVALRIKFKDISLKKYVGLLMHTNSYNPDFWVSALTISYSI